MSEPPKPSAVIGLFTSEGAILDAARRLQELGFRDIAAYTPYPIEGLEEATAPRRRRLLPLMMIGGAVIGAGYGYFLQYWGAVLSYPLNVGGRPYNSWPAFAVSAFEITLLFSVSAGFFALLAACRLPRLYNPIFAAAGFERVTRDRFALGIATSEAGFEARTLRRLLERLGAEEIAEVPA